MKNIGGFGWAKGLEQRGKCLLVACVLGALMSGVMAQAPSQDMALGLIVKLKESAPQSVVRLASSVRPSDGERAQRQRLYSASARTRVGFTAQKPTAFGAHVIHSGRITTLAEAEAEAERLRKDPDVEWVVVNQYEKPAAVARVNSLTPSLNAAYNNQFWLQDKATGGDGVAGFSTAWSAINNSGRKLGAVVTAVLDTGVLMTPPEIQGRLVSPGYDFVSQVSSSNDGDGVDPNPSDPGDYNQNASACDVESSSWHGTMVTGILTSPYNNNLVGPGVLSVLPNEVVLPVRIGGACGALVSDIIEGMLWAAGVDYQGAPSTQNTHPARVLNLSFGGRDNSGQASCDNSTSTGSLYLNTIAILRQKGAVVVASAGNGTNQPGTLGYTTPSRPAACAGVVAVTALRRDGIKAEYANLVSGNVGSAGYIGLAVAGGDTGDDMMLLSNTGLTTPTTTFAISQERGTSFAAPQVAGLIALMFAIDPRLTADQAIDLVRSNLVTTFPNPGGAAQSCSVNTGIFRGNCACDTSTCGAGIVDAGAAVAAALAGVTGGNAWPDTDTSADFAPPALRASFFTPNRILYAERERRGSGGGGAADAGLITMLAALVTWMLGSAMWQRVKARQAAFAFVTSGRR